MFETLTLKPHFCKSTHMYKLDDKVIPQPIFTVKNDIADLSDFPYPLPCRKDEITCSLNVGNIIWFGGKKGLIRYDPVAKEEYNKVIYYSADRDLNDNNVKALFYDEKGVWVLTDTAVTLVEEKTIGAEELADKLLEETVNYVMRRGMVSQKHLKEAKNLQSAYSYDNSDNDGGFTAGFVMGEIFRYAVFSKEKGKNHPDTLKAKTIAVHSLESCLLLMYIHGRGNGFVARTYCCPDEPIPDDGFFFIRHGDKAVCLDTSAARKKGVAGIEIDCSSPIPERLKKHLYNEGYTEDGIVYKADTSSDEITLHVLMLYFAHKLLCDDDSELDELIKASLSNLVNFIIDCDFTLRDFTGEATTWAKWNEDYFMTEDGFVDGALNSAELLFYLKAASEVCDDNQRFIDTYNYLIDQRGYADMTMKHADRLAQLCIATDTEDVENIMYGDHMLAEISFFGLCILENNTELLEKYRYGFKAWNSTIRREYNPGYDFMYLVACPQESTDEYRIKEWFERCNISRLASSVTVVGRHDIPVRTRLAGYKDSCVLLPQDERFISKFDRDPFEYKDVDSGGKFCIESCYLYTLSYWIGRFYGFIKEEK